MDVASLNITKQILNHYPFEKRGEKFFENPIYEAEINDRKIKLITLNQESIYAQNLTDFFVNPELVVFISSIAAKAAPQHFQCTLPAIWAKQNWADFQEGFLFLQPTL